MTTYHYSFNALESLQAFLKVAYPNLRISIEGEKEGKYIECGNIEIEYKLGNYVVGISHFNTCCKLGTMSAEQIATLIYILIENKEKYLELE